MIYNNYNWELLHLWCLKNPRNPNAWIVFWRIRILKLPVAHFKHYKCYFSATLKLNNQIIGGYNCMCIYSIHAITIYFLFPWKLNPFSFWKDYLWSLKELKPALVLVWRCQSFVGAGFSLGWGQGSSCPWSGSFLGVCVPWVPELGLSAHPAQPLCSKQPKSRWGD